VEFENKINLIEMVPIGKLKHYSLNRNKHTKSQIDRLIKLITAHGFRDPLKVDRATMEVICGNGTLMALKKMKVKEVPCVLQDFKSEEERYAFSISHNAVAAWSDIDLSAIHVDLPKLESFDLELLGIKDFQFEPKAGEDSKGKGKEVTCPDCGLTFDV